MGTLVTVLSESGTPVEFSYLVPDRLDDMEAEELLREAVDNFFSRAGVSYIRAAWEDTGGSLSWHDVLAKRHYVDMYFVAYGIERVPAQAEPAPQDAAATVVLDLDECLFPEYWAGKMRAIDAGRRE